MKRNVSLYLRDICDNILRIESFLRGILLQRGHTTDNREGVSAGFRNEGLEDLITKVKVENNETVHPSKVTRIREKFRKDMNMPSICQCG